MRRLVVCVCYYFFIVLYVMLIMWHSPTIGSNLWRRKRLTHRHAMAMTTQLVAIAILMNEHGQIMMVPDDGSTLVSSSEMATAVWRFPSIDVDATETHRHALHRLLINDFGMIDDTE